MASVTQTRPTAVRRAWRLRHARDALHNPSRLVLARPRAVCSVAFLANSTRYWPQTAPCIPSRSAPHPLALSYAEHPKVLSANSGIVMTIFSKAAAGPVGLRRRCSQFCNVLMLTRIKLANSLCERPICSRTCFTSGAASVSRREAGISPRAIALASFRLCRKSSNIAGDIVIALIKVRLKSCSSDRPGRAF